MKLIFDEYFPNNQFVLIGYHLPHILDITDKKSRLADIFHITQTFKKALSF